MIYCNGCPKTGTHLLLKAVKLFGGSAALAAHCHNTEIETNELKHIHIKRNPRNSLISYLRMRDIELTEENLVGEMKSYIEEYQGYTKYLQDASTLTISFEELLTNPEELGRISAYIGKPVIPKHFELIWGGTETFTGTLSNWREYWTSALVRVCWEEYGGVELERSLGYRPDTDKVKVRYFDGD